MVHVVWNDFYLWPSTSLLVLQVALLVLAWGFECGAWRGQSLSKVKRSSGRLCLRLHLLKFTVSPVDLLSVAWRSLGHSLKLVTLTPGWVLIVILMLSVQVSLFILLTQRTNDSANQEKMLFGLQGKNRWGVVVRQTVVPSP